MDEEGRKRCFVNRDVVIATAVWRQDCLFTRRVNTFSKYIHRQLHLHLGTGQGNPRWPDTLLTAYPSPLDDMIFFLDRILGYMFDTCILYSLSNVFLAMRPLHFWMHQYLAVKYQFIEGYVGCNNIVFWAVISTFRFVHWCNENKSRSLRSMLGH